MSNSFTADERNRSIGLRFGEAAGDYDEHAEAQRIAATRLTEKIVAALAKKRLSSPLRILEIGCGTGLFTRELAARIGPADWTVTDISESMLSTAQGALHLPGTSRFLVVDGERLDTCEAIGDRHYDVICSNFAVQWFANLNQGLGQLAKYLVPGGILAISTLAEDTFREWRDAHTALHLTPSIHRYPAAHEIAPTLRKTHDIERKPLHGRVDAEHIVLPQNDGLSFLRGLKKIGADAPSKDTRPLTAPVLKRVIAYFNQTGAHVTYHVAYGVWQNDATSVPGVFVTGTDTGIGKTLVSAVLTRAWQADYWKPLQTGIADEAGDTPTVRDLANVPAERLHEPAYALQAPLSPWAAAPLENIEIDSDAITLPETSNTLVVEGAGGLFVPIDDRTMMIDFIARLGLPVVLVARSGLGTINHTLLSLEALKRRALPVLGVIMVGALSPDNKRAIEQFGGISVLAEIPVLDVVDAAAVDALAQRMPSLNSCLEAAARRDETN